VSDFDAIADELYGLRPDEFAAARDEHVRKAKSDGQQPLARELSKLRRPTQSAWLLNLLWRDQREVIQQFLEVAEGLSRAQAQAAGAEMRSLNAQRRQLEAALIRQARSLAEKAGVAVAATTEREAQETLAAALARPDVAEEMRTGRLVKPASYAGFGTPISTPTRDTHAGELPEPTRLADARRSAKDGDEADARRSAKDGDEADAKAAERERRAAERRAAAEQAVAEARAAVESAAGELAEQSHAADTAQQHAQELQTQVDQLRAQLRVVEATATEAKETARSAQTRQEQANKTHAAAQRALEQAEQALATAQSNA
jgi:hypothetical protein